MSCWGCDSAKKYVRSGYFASGCQECQARMLAHSPTFHDSSQANAITPKYRDVLLAVFGDRWRIGHDLVKKWAQRLAEK